MERSELIDKLRTLAYNGIHTPAELAEGLGISIDMFKNIMDDELLHIVHKTKIEHKVFLNKLMTEYAVNGDFKDSTKVAATKFLLSSVHRQCEQSAKLAEERKKNKFYQTMSAARFSTLWDDDTTEKFINNISKIEKAL